MPTITIRDIEAAPGTKVSGGAKCGEWADGSPIQVPITIVNGAEPGPVFLAIACFHGDEMVGTEAIRRVTASLDPQKMKGAFIGVLAANAVAFLMGQRVNILESPAGSNDMKKVLRTATANGSLTERMAAFVRDEVASHCDYYADIHSSAAGSVNYPRAIVAGDYLELDAELRKKVDDLAEACNIEYVFKASGEKWEGMYFQPTHVLEEDYGKAGIVLETGYAPTFEGAEVITDSMTNILKKIGVIEGTAERTVPLTYVDRLVATRANAGGLWHPEVGIPDHVKKGDLLGRIYGLDGSVREEITSPANGVVIKVANTATITTGVRTHVLGIPHGQN
jgi:uncharacterized protein